MIAKTTTSVKRAINHKTPTVAKRATKRKTTTKHKRAMNDETPTGSKRKTIGGNMTEHLDVMKKLVSLRECAIKMCEEAYHTKDAFKGESINWGDFSCISRVILSEASPNSPRIRAWMTAKLALAGFAYVEVRCQEDR